MREKHENILWLAIMLLCVFFAVNWIYGRTQLSGWMPLPFSIMLLVGATFQSFDLVGKLLGPSKTFARQLGTVSVVISVVVSISALVIFSLTQAPDANSVAAEGPYMPVQGIPAPNDLVIEVSNSAYGFRAEGSTTTDLESLIARCQKLISSSPDRQVVIFAESDVSIKRVVEVMSALTDAGVSNINIATGTN